MFQKAVSSVLIFLILTTGLISPVTSHARDMETITLAVLNLSAQGISESEASFLSEHLHAEVTRVASSEDFKRTTGINYILVERSQMDKIFDQFDIQNTGCTDVSCAVEFGKMLSAQRIVIGSVGLVGKTCSITTRIVDVETGSTLSVAGYTYTGSVEELLTKGIQNVVNELLYGVKKKSHKKLYIISGLSLAAIGAALVILSSPKTPEKENPGNVYIQIPVPDD